MKTRLMTPRLILSFVTSRDLITPPAFAGPYAADSLLEHYHIFGSLQGQNAVTDMATALFEPFSLVYRR